jgi:NAD(P)-dependent dehydrogenase (short-subunit alcohol dehydrogenase family)
VDIPEDEWERVIRVSLTGVFLCVGGYATAPVKGKGAVAYLPATSRRNLLD